MNTVLTSIIGLVGIAVGALLTFLFGLRSNRKNRIAERKEKAVCAIYGSLDKAIRYMKYAISPWQECSDESFRETVKLAGKYGNEFIDTYSLNKIYLSKDLAGRLDNINQNMNKNWQDFVLANPKLTNDPIKSTKDWDNAWNSFVEGDVKHALDELELEFREILGSD